MITGKQRYLAGIQGVRLDRTAVGSPTSVATVEQMEKTGAFFPDVHLDGKKMAHLAAGAYEILGYDAIMPVFSVVQEAAALGCEIDWGLIDQMPVDRTHPWREPQQVQIPADFLENPSIRAVLEALQILSKEYSSRAAIIGKVMGPWTLSYAMHGIQDFLMETLLDPEKVRRFLDRLKEVTILFGKAQLDAGADALCLADHATGDLVRGAMYRDFLQPVHNEILHELNCPVILHICGRTLDRMTFISEAGFPAFHFDSKNDACEAVLAAGRNLALVGNINNPEILLHGTPDQAAERTHYAIEAGVRIVAPECAVPLRTPVENLRAIAEVARGNHAALRSPGSR